MAFSISSPSFRNGKDIPKNFTCDGDDVSPALSWMDPPQGVKSFALIADDPDAPKGTWTHWVLVDLPPSTSYLPEGVPKVGELPDGGRQGINDFPKSAMEAHARLPANRIVTFSSCMRLTTSSI